MTVVYKCYFYFFSLVKAFECFGFKITFFGTLIRHNHSRNILSRRTPYKK